MAARLRATVHVFAALLRRPHAPGGVHSRVFFAGERKTLEHQAQEVAAG